MSTVNESDLIGSEFTYEWSPLYGPRKGEVLTDTHEFYWSDWAFDVPREGVQVPGVGRVFRAQQHGGEGEGDQAWIVLRIEREDGTEEFYRKDGFYASFEGFDWDGEFYQVVPTPKTITVYEAV